MSGGEEPKIFEKKGLKYNGFRIPWPFVGIFVALVSNAAVIQYKVSGYDTFQHDVIVRLDEISRKQGSTSQETAVTANRVENLIDTVRYHRLHEHRDTVRAPGGNSSTSPERGRP